MPINSNMSFGDIVKREMEAGKPQKQAVAIAYSEKGEHRAEGGEMDIEKMKRQWAMKNGLMDPEEGDPAMEALEGLDPEGEGDPADESFNHDFRERTAFGSDDREGDDPRAEHLADGGEADEWEPEIDLPFGNSEDERNGVISALDKIIALCEDPDIEELDSGDGEMEEDGEPRAVEIEVEGHGPADEKEEKSLEDMLNEGKEEEKRPHRGFRNFLA